MQITVGQGDTFVIRPTCTYGTGKTKVALVGNSHAGHWLPALEEVGKVKGWTITTFLASVCSPSDAELDFKSQEKSEGCLDYADWVLDKTGHGQFDLILASARQSLPVVGETSRQRPSCRGRL